MREILFRAKNYGNEWVYGLLGYCNFNLGVEKAIYVVNEYGSIMPDRIKPETVGQFTGFYDKNGNRIFEGDIVKVDVSKIYGNGEIVGVIEYSDKYARFICKSCLMNLICWTTYDDIEVIGSIYDNPELIKGE